MIALLWLILIAVIVVAVLFIAIDYIAGAAKVDGRLWLLLKGLIVLLALVYVLQRSGVV